MTWSYEEALKRDPREWTKVHRLTSLEDREEARVEWPSAADASAPTAYREGYIDIDSRGDVRFLTPSGLSLRITSASQVEVKREPAARSKRLG